MSTQKQKKGKRPDNRPARKKYWITGRLARNKIRNMIRCGRMTFNAAVTAWESSRNRRLGKKHGFIVDRHGLKRELKV